MKMQSIMKLRVYDQRLDETIVKVLSGFEEYWTVIILFDRGVSRTLERFREIDDDAPLLLSFSHVALSSVGNRFKDGSQAHFASFYHFRDNLGVGAALLRRHNVLLLLLQLAKE